MWNVEKKTCFMLVKANINYTQFSYYNNIRQTLILKICMPDLYFFLDVDCPWKWKYLQNKFCFRWYNQNNIGIKCISESSNFIIIIILVWHPHGCFLKPFRHLISLILQEKVNNNICVNTKKIHLTFKYYKQNIFPLYFDVIL